MRVCDNGVYRNATPEEIAAWEAADNSVPLDQLQSARQEENKAALASWLASHPLTWTDGKQYGVEEQDQNEMALNLMQYQAAQCRPFELDEYLALSMAISTYVYPYRRYQESIKTAIYAAATAQEVRAIVIDYSSVEVTI